MGFHKGQLRHCHRSKMPPLVPVQVCTGAQMHDIGRRGGQLLRTLLEWMPSKKIWNYSLAVNHMPIPFTWTRVGGPCKRKEHGSFVMLLHCTTRVVYVFIGYSVKCIHWILSFHWRYPLSVCLLSISSQDISQCIEWILCSPWMLCQKFKW